MAETKTLLVKDLDLDLANYRTMPQQSEVDAIQAMISTSPNWLWALMKSLLDDGYLPIENILVLQDGENTRKKFIVKEGNRRIGMLKIILGLIDYEQLDISPSFKKDIAQLDHSWRNTNSKVPCIVYSSKERETVDRIVSLAHGKGERARKEKWNAVGGARHNREENAGNEAGLDLLEKYLQSGKNLTPQQNMRWSGDYPLTVLNEAITKIAPRLGYSGTSELAASYPSCENRDGLENMIRDIGLKGFGFPEIRNKDKDFAATYGVPPNKEGKGTGKGSKSQGKGSGSTKAKAASANTTQAVKKLLKGFTPKGDGREKVALLRDEAHALSLKNNPLAFCFVLRSMFEISAKAYCSDHSASGGPSPTKANGHDKALAKLLKDICQHLKNDENDTNMTKKLHGAISELARPEGLLSVTSMNQLVHNPTFLVTTTDISTLFGNIFPLLEAMND